MEVKAEPRRVMAWYVPMAKPREALDVPNITSIPPNRKWDQHRPHKALAASKAVKPQALEYRKVEITARERGCNSIQLNSNKRRIRAHKFYQKLGFMEMSLKFEKIL